MLPCMKSLILPPRLRKGDTIGLVSPSAGIAPFAPQRIERARAFFEEEGYKTSVAAHALQNAGYVAASAEARAEDINAMFGDPNVTLIIATLGGNHSNRLLNLLDYESIRAHPKAFFGYSDNTVLHFALASQAHLASYYGPCAMTQFGEFPRVLDYTWEAFRWAIADEMGSDTRDIRPSQTWTDEILDWFSGEDGKRPREMRPNSGYEWLQAGKAKGSAWGGAIPSINHLAGTRYWVDPEDSIFFLDIPEGHDLHSGLSISDVDAALADLDNLGVFERMHGLIVGRPCSYTDEMMVELKHLLLSYVKKKTCPILLNANVGHADPIFTWRFGATVELDSDRSLFRLSR